MRRAPRARGGGEWLGRALERERDPFRVRALRFERAELARREGRGDEALADYLAAGPPARDALSARARLAAARLLAAGARSPEALELARSAAEIARLHAGAAGMALVERQALRLTARLARAKP